MADDCSLFNSLVVEGFVKSGKAKEPDQPSTLKLTNKPVETPAKATPQVIAEMQAEEDAEAELQAILAQATVEPPSEITEKLIRTLREG